MASKGNKKNNPQEEAGNVLAFLAKMVQDSAVTIFWESVDKFKKEVKIKLEIGFKFILGVSAILTGLIFVLIGIADFLEAALDIKGIGYVLTGIFVVLAGVWAGERAKQQGK